MTFCGSMAAMTVCSGPDFDTPSTVPTMIRDRNMLIGQRRATEHAKVDRLADVLLDVQGLSHSQGSFRLDCMTLSILEGQCV